MSKRPAVPDKLFFRIGEVARLLEVRPHVLRYWETEFPSVSPRKSASGQRVYRKVDVETLVTIQQLLYEERYSIDGARKRLKQLKQSDTQVSVHSEEISGDTREKLCQLTRELVSLAGISLSTLFKF